MCHFIVAIFYSRNATIVRLMRLGFMWTCFVKVIQHNTKSLECLFKYNVINNLS